METTSTGLLVPDGTLPKRCEVWLADDARTLRRALKLLADHALQLAVRCPACQQGCEPQPCYETGDTFLECGCTVRHLQGWWWRGRRQADETVNTPESPAP